MPDAAYDRGTRPALVPAAAVSRRDAVSAEIRRAIITGALRPAEKLTELSLAASLQVSRATIREALGQLVREGLVVAEPYRGMWVADLDAQAVRDLAQTRLSLDLLAARTIVADQTGRRLEAVRAAWAGFERTVYTPDPVLRHTEHLAFHRAIWLAADNVVLTQLWPVIEAHMTIALAQDQALRPSADRAHQTHAQLVEAFETRDLDTIEAALVAHDVTTADELIALRTNGPFPS